MKKIRILLLLIISVFIFNTNALAASCSLSVSRASVYVGDSFTVSANVSLAAAWNVHVVASGPVSNCVINQADASIDAMDTNKVFSATCTATGQGTITLRLSGDVTSANDGNAVNVSGTQTVIVSEKKEQPTNNQNNYKDNRSKNNNIKKLQVENYEIKEIDKNNYLLEVENNVTSINIYATLEDSKASITGTGTHNLNVGENNIELVVTAENNSQRKVNIKVIRKDGYYLSDLDLALKNDEVNIIIDQDTIITSQDLEKVKISKKIVNFNYYDESKTLLYSWIIDGSKLNGTNDFSTLVSNSSTNKKEILKLSNYADGLFIELKQSNNLSGIKLKIYVGDKYEDSDLVNLYSYEKENNKLELLKDKIKVENGYAEFENLKFSDYLITMSNIHHSESINQSENNTNNILIIILIICILLIISLIAFIIKNIKINHNNNDNNLNKIGR